MILPTIHLNGTDAESLFEQTCEVAGKLRAALVALDEAAPNARDYYPQGDRAFAQARTEHQARAAKLREVLQELEAIAEHVAEERDRRTAPRRP